MKSAPPAWVAILGAVVLSMAGHVARAQTSSGDGSTPLPTDLVEEQTVRLVILDLLVLDGQDRTVPDLTLDDFEVLVGGKPVAPDTLDVACDDTLDDARVVRRPELRTAPGGDVDTPRKIVLAFDYQHLPGNLRPEVLDRAQELVENLDVDGEELMIVALNGGLRIEQVFTADREEAGLSLRRMQRDITLWSPSFDHMSEVGWVRGMTTLFDVLATVPGPKAVVYFSAMGDVPLDSQHADLAAQAANSRCRVYPVDARGLGVGSAPLQASGWGQTTTVSAAPG